MNIYEKLLEIQKATHLDKPENNKFAGFMYRTIEQIFNFLKPLFSKYKLFAFFSDSIINHETKILSITLNILDLESTTKDFSKIQIIKEIFIDLNKAKMDDSQKVNSAETFAKKRMLENLFLINTEPDPDSLDNTQPDDKPEPLVTQPQLKKMFAMMKEAGITEEKMKKSLKNRYSLESSKDLNVSQMNDIYKFLDSVIQEKKKNEAPDIMGEL